MTRKERRAAARAAHKLAEATFRVADAADRLAAQQRAIERYTVYTREGEGRYKVASRRWSEVNQCPVVKYERRSTVKRSRPKATPWHSAMVYAK